MGEPHVTGAAIAATPEFLSYCDALEHFLSSGAHETDMRERAKALAEAARRQRVAPEHIMIALRAVTDRMGLADAKFHRDADRSRRYAEAITALLAEYFLQA